MDRVRTRMQHDLEQINREQSFSERDSFTERRYRQFARHLGRFTGQVLDIGCNTGRGGQAFLASSPGVQLDGVELLADRIARIPRGLYRSVHQGLLGDIPQDAGPYDAILMGELVEHVTHSSFEEFVEQSVSLLAPGGQMLLTTPNPHYMLLRQRAGGSVLGGAHVSVHCPVALGQFLTWKGLAVRVIAGSGQVSRLLGERFPMFMYGSYLLIARKPA
jgi:2-polyprenyl-3-methyl-5-hydroxy-6-metoxy-1,4-benzoquinol methylase